MQDDDEDLRNVGRQKNERAAAQEITKSYPDTLSVFGELTSIARRFRLRQLEQLIDQERAVVEAHRNLMAAQEAWQVAAERLKPENLQEIKQAEALKVRAERAEQEFRLAEAKRKIATFERRARIDDILLEAEEEEARLRLERAMQARAAFSNPQPEPEPEPQPDLEAALMKVVQELSGLEQEINELRSQGASEAQISVVEFKISACLRRKAALEEKLAGI
jgi:hypothetical protein